MSISLLALFAVLAGPAVGSAAAKPVVNLLPEVTVGHLQIGERAGCGAGSWSESEPLKYSIKGFKYKWIRAGVPISTREEVSYVLSAADEGKEVWCVVQAISTSGEVSEAESSNSLILPCKSSCKAEPTEPPSPQVPLPLVSGEAKVGATLSCSSGSWGNEPTSFAYKWLRDKTEVISKATSSTYKLTEEDEGRSVSCKVTAENARGPTTVESSNSVSLIGSPPTAKKPPTITGINEVGQQLTCSNEASNWEGSRPLTFKYAWLRNEELTTVTGGIYPVEPVDEGASLRCRIIASNIVGTSKEKEGTSLPVKILPRLPENTVQPEIKGNPAPGSKLTCSEGTWTGPTPTFEWKWLRGPERVPVHAGQEYVLPTGEGESGYTLYCGVTATNGRGKTTRESAPVVVPAEVPGLPPEAVSPPVPPLISPGEEKGEVLSCSTGSWKNEPTEFVYQWARIRGGVEVSLELGAGSSYIVVPEDEGSRLVCRVTAVNSHGKATQKSAEREIPGTKPLPGNPGPRLIGSGQVGESLSCLHEEWSGAPRPTFNYQWKRGSEVLAATGAAYTVVAADKGNSLTCAVTASNNLGKDTVVTNEIYVLGSAPEGETPTITGKPELGEGLICVPNTWTGAPTPTLTYQWLLNGVPDPGETTHEFTVGLADRGLVITCRVTGTSHEGVASATSKGLRVPGIRPQDVTPPAISGSAALGATLTCNRGIWKGSPPPSFTYQWLRDGVAIGGATASTYIVEPADQGHLISCIVTGANSEATVEAESTNGLAIPMRLATSGVSGFTATGTIVKRPSAATILASLKLQLTRAGRGLHLSSVRKHGGFTFPFTAPAAGTLEMRWYETVKAAHSSSKKTTQLLVGRTSGVYTAAIKRTMHLKLTSKGRAALKGKKQVKIIVRGIFTVTHGGPVTWTGSLLLSH